jgi:hypothetical protein
LKTAPEHLGCYGLVHLITLLIVQIHSPLLFCFAAVVLAASGAQANVALAPPFKDRDLSRLVRDANDATKKIAHAQFPQIREFEVRPSAMPGRMTPCTPIGPMARDCQLQLSAQTTGQTNLS